MHIGISVEKLLGQFMAVVDGLANNVVFLRSLTTNVNRWRVIGSTVGKFGMSNQLLW